MNETLDNSEVADYSISTLFRSFNMQADEFGSNIQEKITYKCVWNLCYY